MSSSDVRWRATGEGERASGSSKAPPASDADSPPQVFLKYFSTL